MRKYLGVISICCVCLMGAQVRAQKADIAVGGGSLFSSGGTYNGGLLPSESGGTFLGVSGDYLFKGHLGVQGEVFWRVSQGLYGGAIPYRPVFWDFNAIYSRRFNRAIGFEALGGVGAETVRFYSGAYNCDAYGNCTNYISNNHFMADGGAGLRLYMFHNFFVRPEVRVYIIPNNKNPGSSSSYPGFSSNYPVRYGASLGYTFGGSKY